MAHNGRNPLGGFGPQYGPPYVGNGGSMQQPPGAGSNLYSVNPATVPPNGNARDWGQRSGYVNGPPAPGGYMPMPTASDATDATQNFLYESVKRDEAARRERATRPVHNSSNTNVRPPNPHVTDVVGSIINAQERYEVSHEAIFRTVQFVANNKYCTNPTAPQTNLVWTITSNPDGSVGNIVLGDDDVMGNIVRVGLEPFTLPTSMFSASDIYYGVVQVHLGSVPNSKNSIYDYGGGPTSVQASMFHFNCELSTGANSGQYVATPTRKHLDFGVPTGITNSQWRVSFRRPMLVGAPLTVPPAALNGTTGVSANPLVINATGSNIASGTLVTIDTLGLNGAGTTSYVAFNVQYAATAIGANSFSVPVDGTTIAASQSVSIGLPTNVIMMATSVVSLDKKADLISSARAVMTLE